MGVLATLNIGPTPFLQLVQKSATRKERAAKRLKYYRDQQSDELLRLIQQRWAEPEKFRMMQINAVKKIINRLATVYALTPKRTFEGWDQKKGDELYRQIKTDVVLKKAQRLTKLLKTSVLRVAWDEERGVALYTCTPNILDAVYQNPEWPERMIVTHPGPDDRPELVQYDDWTSQTYARRDHRGSEISRADNPNSVNPYGLLPFVPLFDYAPDDKFFLVGGDDLIETQEAINVGLANLWRAIELQSHGQAYAVGLPPGDSLRAGPDRTINLPEGGSFGFAAPNSPIEETLKALEFLVKQTAVANDLPSNVFDLDHKAESGIAKVAESRDLIEARKDDIALWRNIEHRLFEVIKTVVNTHRPRSIPKDAKIKIDFGDMTPVLDETARLEGHQRKLDLGIWSQVDVLMAENPDIRDRDEAVEILEARQSERAVFSDLGA